MYRCSTEFALTGIVAGSVTLMVSCALSMYCMLLIVDAKNAAYQRGDKIATYAGKHNNKRHTWQYIL